MIRHEPRCAAAELDAPAIPDAAVDAVLVTRHGYAGEWPGRRAGVRAELAAALRHLVTDDTVAVAVVGPCPPEPEPESASSGWSAWPSDPTREEWLAARERMRKKAQDIPLNAFPAELDGLTEAVLGPCPPEPPSITDAMVERAAKAIAHEFYVLDNARSETARQPALPFPTAPYFKQIARRALEAALGGAA